MLPLLLTLAAAQAESSLHFDGVDDHVTMGVAESLGLEAFTLECWLRWDGEGSSTSSSGSGGVSFHPLLGKGRGESDGSEVDMAYGLGVEATTGVLCADFEDMADGSNHPVTGNTDLRDGLWHHAAVSYDGSAWALYLDGALDGSADTGGATPRHDSVQHLAVGTAMDSDGDPSGRFRGAIDEVRIWSRARSAEEIRGSMNQALGAGAGLVARWGFDEGGGEVAHDAIGSVDGALVGAAWTSQAPFDASLPPDEPVLIGPEDGASGVGTPALLQVAVDDPEGDPLVVRFYGRIAQPDPDDFTVVALPDTQYYCSGGNGGSAEMFLAQTEWIVQQRDALAIAWVAHNGDLVNNGDDDEAQWLVADQALSVLEDPSTTGLPDGIPYGVGIGNHDQDPAGDPLGTTTFFNAYFGAERFEGRAYYGGHLGEDNDDHWGTFSAGGEEFLVIDLEFDQYGADEEVLPWADALIQAHPEHWVIVNAHHLIEEDGSFSDQGADVYGALGHHERLLLMLSGHLTAEVRRSDPAGGGGTVHTIMADYQFDGDGGAGWLRVMELSPGAGEIRVSTYSPWLDQSQTDEESAFVLPWSVGSSSWELLGTASVEAGDEAALSWEGIEPANTYEWRVEVDDDRGVTSGPTWSFTTGEASGDTGPFDSAEGQAPGVRHPQDGCGCSGHRGRAPAALLLALLLLPRRRRPALD